MTIYVNNPITLLIITALVAVFIVLLPYIDRRVCRKLGLNLQHGISDNAKTYGDQPLSFWQDCLVFEDPAHVQNVYFEVFDQVQQWCASK